MSIKLSKQVKTKKKVNYVTFLIDVSGSMHGLESKVAELCNANIKDLKEQSRIHGIETYVSILIFDVHTDVIVREVNVDVVKEITIRDVSNRNNYTRLMDSVADAIEFVENIKVNKNDDVSYLLIGLTDGGENSSVRINAGKLKTLIKNQHDKGNLTLTFNVPPGSKKDILQYGFYDDNIREWETTTKGLEKTSAVNTYSLNSYYNARSAGAKSLTNFYQVDLSDVTSRDLKQLDNLQNKFKVFEVTKESAIKEFVEEKGFNYIPGSCFYELTKKETIQANKEILVQEKGKMALYGGNEARDLIGLPQGKDVKVEPLNLSKYRVFVLSTSVNRKLVRGSKLLVTI